MNALEIKNLTKRYPGFTLDNLNLTLPSGCIMGDGWSIAWRVHDAQFWGVPQRRKRIALVADFGGSTAPEILFERQGLSGNTEESGEKGQGITATSEGNTFETISFQERAGKPGGGQRNTDTE